jgi:hypothetical protein
MRLIASTLKNHIRHFDTTHSVINNIIIWTNLEQIYLANLDLTFSKFQVLRTTMDSALTDVTKY